MSVTQIALFRTLAAILKKGSNTLPDSPLLKTTWVRSQTQSWKTMPNVGDIECCFLADYLVQGQALLFIYDGKK